MLKLGLKKIIFACVILLLTGYFIFLHPSIINYKVDALEKTYEELKNLIADGAINYGDGFLVSDRYDYTSHNYKFSSVDGDNKDKPGDEAVCIAVRVPPEKVFRNYKAYTTKEENAHFNTFHYYIDDPEAFAKTYGLQFMWVSVEEFGTSPYLRFDSENYSYYVHQTPHTREYDIYGNSLGVAEGSHVIITEKGSDLSDKQFSIKYNRLGIGLPFSSFNENLDVRVWLYAHSDGYQMRFMYYPNFYYVYYHFAEQDVNGLTLCYKSNYRNYEDNMSGDEICVGVTGNYDYAKLRCWMFFEYLAENGAMQLNEFADNYKLDLISTGSAINGVSWQNKKITTEYAAFDDINTNTRFFIQVYKDEKFGGQPYIDYMAQVIAYSIDYCSQKGLKPDFVNY